MTKISPARKSLAKLARKKSTGFPIGTIAYYGPTDQFATKVSVGILDQNDKILEMKRWFSTDHDIRLDDEMCRQIVDFLEKHEVYRVGMMDKIIGCPHEEGIDYPVGETCPECPFWAGRDRWTGELLH